MYRSVLLFVLLFGATASPAASAGAGQTITDVEVNNLLVDATDLQAVTALSKRLADADCRQKLVSGVRDTLALREGSAIPNLLAYQACPSQPPELRRTAQFFLGMAAMRYGAHAVAATALTAAIGHRAADNLKDSGIAVAKALAGENRPRVVQPPVAWVRASLTNYGQLIAEATINGRNVLAHLDTGAMLSAMSVSWAKELNLRMLPGLIQINTPGGRSFAARIGIARQVGLGTIKIYDVPFLVTSDADASPNKMPLKPFLGFPLLSRLGKIDVAFDEGHYLLRVGHTLAAPDDRSNMIATWEPRLTLAVAGNKNKMFDFDTGSTITHIYADCFNSMKANLPQPNGMQMKSFVFGNTTESTIRKLDHVAFSDGVSERLLTDVAIDTLSMTPGACGRLGFDAMMEEATVDFDAMRFSFATYKLVRPKNRQN